MEFPRAYLGLILERGNMKETFQEGGGKILFSPKNTKFLQKLTFFFLEKYVRQRAATPSAPLGTPMGIPLNANPCCISMYLPI